jgi:predicted ATP-dependent endonuclease of OLD family
MILKSVRVTNYKCINDSEEFSLEQVTALIGKNESGKTAILQALEKLNSIVPELANFKLEEFPRATFYDFDDSNRPENVLTTVWQLEEPEITAVAKIIGFSVLNSNNITIKKGYKNKRTWELSLDEVSAIKALLDNSSLEAGERQKLAGQPHISMLITELSKLPTPSDRQTQFLNQLKSQIDGSLTATIISVLEPHLPAFLYFGSYNLMPGKVAIEALMNRESSATFSLDDRVFLALLKMAGTSTQDLRQLTQFEALNAKLEGISNKLSKEIFNYWSQNKHLKIKFDYRPALPEDSAPFNSGNIFHTRIENTRHQVTVSFDERSTGFVWFFSFLVWFSQIKTEHQSPLILLLDEPGLNLHAKAQADLLRYFDEVLKPNHQVIYSTHSPFMINANALISARIVEDVIKKDILLKTDILLGTKVSADILVTDKDTLFPLQAALGYEITQTLFIGEHTLLVEGPSEIMAFQWANHELRKQKRTTLDSRWVISPAGGIDKISSFVSLFGGNKLHVATFTDFAHGDKTKIQRLKENELLQQNHVFTAADLTGAAEADLEDVLGRDFYVKLVNTCYELTKKNAVPEVKPTTASIRVVKEVEEHFRSLPATVPEFDHFSPCAYLLRNADSLRTTLPGIADSLDRFEILFSALNKLL